MRVATGLLAALLLTLPAAIAESVDEDPGEVLLSYKPGTGPDAIDLAHQLGGKVIRQNEELRVVVVETKSVTQFIATALLAPVVEYAERNDDVRQAGAQWNGAQWNGAQWNGAQWNGAQWNSDTPGDPGAGEQWGLAAVNAPAAWNVTTGSRHAALCVLDSGVAYDHIDLEDNVWRAADGTAGYNAIDPRLPPYDDAGHGTHMAGIAAATVRNSIGVAGMGNVSIISVKVLAADGTGHEDDLAAGLVWCANNGAEVALMALSVDNEGPTVRNALQYAAERDVLLVASAGNDGACTSCVAYPARDKNVLAVSAVDQNDTLASFSSRGPQVDLAAPGVEVVSTFLADGYASGSGTSQAAAFVAGAAALLRDHNPDWDAARAEDRLESSARDVGSAGKDAQTGHGVLDAGGALGG